MSGPGRPGPPRGGVRAAGPAHTAGAPIASAAIHDSRPSLAPTVPGTIPGATTASTECQVETDAPAPGGALRSAYSPAPARCGADSPRSRPGGVATAAHRPQLVLTFGAE